MPDNSRHRLHYRLISVVVKQHEQIRKHARMNRREWPNSSHMQPSPSSVRAPIRIPPHPPTGLAHAGPSTALILIIMQSTSLNCDAQAR